MSKPKQVPPGSVPHQSALAPCPTSSKVPGLLLEQPEPGLCQTLPAELRGLLLPTSHPSLLQGQEGLRWVHGAILGPALPLSSTGACFSIIRQLIARWDGIDGCASVIGIYFESFEVSAASSRSRQQGETGASNLYCLLLFQMSLIIKCLWNGGGK